MEDKTPPVSILANVAKTLLSSADVAKKLAGGIDADVFDEMNSLIDDVHTSMCDIVAKARAAPNGSSNREFIDECYSHLDTLRHHCKDLSSNLDVIQSKLPKLIALLDNAKKVEQLYDEFISECESAAADSLRKFTCAASHRKLYKLTNRETREVYHLAYGKDLDVEIHGWKLLTVDVRQVTNGKATLFFAYFTHRENHATIVCKFAQNFSTVDLVHCESRYKHKINVELAFEMVENAQK